VRALWHSPTIRSTVVLGTAGAGFAAANLILARLLPTEEYALFTLVVALVNVGFALAPAGIDGMVNRVRLEAGPRLLGRTMRATTAVGILFGLIALAGYGLSPSLALMILVATATGGALMVAGAQFQSEQRYGLSLAIMQSPNIVLLLSALAVGLTGVRAAWPPLLVWTAGFVVVAAWAWSVLFAERHDKPHRGADFPWIEALSFAGVHAAGLVLIQLDRLVIPHVLTVEDLALYGVLAAIVGSLFRVLQMGVGYSLLPRLRAAPDVLVRRRLIARESRLVAAVVVAGSLTIWVVTPLVERLFLAGKYHLTAPLILAAVITGVAKILNAFTKSTVSALADTRELTVVNALGWVSVAVAVVASAFGARWGLVGVIYGVGLGWLVRAVSAMYYTARHLRLPRPAPAVTP